MSGLVRVRMPNDLSRPQGGVQHQAPGRNHAIDQVDLKQPVESIENASPAQPTIGSWSEFLISLHPNILPHRSTSDCMIPVLGMIGGKVLIFPIRWLDLSGALPMLGADAIYSHTSRLERGC